MPGRAKPRKSRDQRVNWGCYGLSRLAAIQLLQKSCRGQRTEIETECTEPKASAKALFISALYR